MKRSPLHAIDLHATGGVPLESDPLMDKGFLKAGNVPTRFASFLHSDLSFMTSVPLGVAIATSLHPDAALGALTVARPGLAGPTPRTVSGLLVHR